MANDNLDAVARKNEAYLRQQLEELRSLSIEGALAKLKEMASTGINPPEVVWVSRGGRVAVKGLGKGQPIGMSVAKWEVLFRDNDALLNDIKAMVKDARENPDKYEVDEDEEEVAETPEKAEQPTAAEPAKKPEKSK